MSEEDNDHYSVDLAKDREEDNLELELPDIFTMSLCSYKSSSFKYKYPCIIYPYTKNIPKKVYINLLVHPIPRDSFKCTFNSARTQVLIYTKGPKMFTLSDCIMEADTTLGNYNSKTVLIDEVVAEIEKRR